MAKIKVNIFETATTFEPVSKIFSIPVSDWKLTNGKYIAVVSDAEIASKTFADVFFDEICLDVVDNAKITAEINGTGLYITFTSENLPTDTISGVYYLFEEESFMAKVRLNTCNTCNYNGGSGEPVTLNGAEVNNVSVTGANVSIQGKNATITGGGSGLNNVSISGGNATLSNGDLTISIDSQTDENFTSAEKMKLNSVETNAQENVIETIYFDGVLVPVDSKTVSLTSSGSSIQKSDPQFSLSANQITVSDYFDLTIPNVTLSAVSDGITTITSYSDIASVTRISADEFKITPLKKGSTNLLAQISETADYYSSQKKLPIIITQDVGIILLPLNSDITDYGTENLTWTPKITPTFSNGLDLSGQELTTTNGFVFDDKDFTVSFTAQFTSTDASGFSRLTCGEGGCLQINIRPTGIWFGHHSVDWVNHIDFTVPDTEATYKIQRQGDTFSCYVDDVLQGSFTSTTSFAPACNSLFQNFEGTIKNFIIQIDD